MRTIYSIIASLKNESGHFFEYNSVFSKAARMNNLKHIKIIPKTAKIPNLDDSWQKVIYEINHEKKWKNIKNVIPFINVLRKIKKEKNAIIFLEDFNLIILLLLLTASIIVRPKSELWLLHRYEYDKTFGDGKAYKVIQGAFEKVFTKERVKYLTDSELIKKINGCFFNRKFHVLPIPHIYFSEEIKPIKNKVKTFWWPGGSVREEKGLENIKKLVNSLEESDNIKIALADCVKDFVSNKSVVIFIPTNLTRKDYEKRMICSDLILLPYVSNLYRYRTSGIFVEAIVAGSVPVVSKETWMSYELAKYELNELTVDWNSPNIIEKLKLISENSDIKNKLMIMRQSYEKTHSIENYALAMKSVLNQTI